MADNMPLVARIMVQHGGGGPPTGPGVSSASAGNVAGEPKETTKNIKKISTSMAQNTKGVMANLGKAMGIHVGIASILKQSQVFTGYIGTIFQLMGALVDVILAPFLPIVIPAIKLLASFIPIASELMKDTFAWLVKGFTWLKEGFKSLMRFFGISLKGLPQGIVDKLKKIILATVIVGTLLKMFGVLKFFGQGAVWIGKQQLSALHMVARNVLMANRGIVGGNAAAKAGRGKMLKTSIRGFGRIGGLVVLFTAVAGILMLGFSGLTRLFGKSHANQTRNLEGQLRFERSNTLATETGTSTVETVLTTGLGLVHGGLILGQLATRTVGIRVASMFTGLKNLGMKQGRDALGRFTKNASMWSRMGAKATNAAGAIRTGIKVSMKSVAQVLTNKFPKLGKKITEMKTRVAQVLTDKFPKLGKKITEMKVAFKKNIVELGSRLKGFFSNLGRSLGGLLKRIPGVSKVVDVAKGVGRSIKGFLFGKGGATASKGLLSKIGSAAKVIPVLGSVAELVYGSYKTYKSFKDYGMKAGLARAGVTLAATVGALVDPTGIASAVGSIGAHAGLSFAERKGVFGPGRNGTYSSPQDSPLVINLNVNTNIVSLLESQQVRTQGTANETITIESKVLPDVPGGL